ncbi:hypothetical protein [Thermococcus cleftensis]|nr:hypothetical protein [Thermococcus cleftensis]
MLTVSLTPAGTEPGWEWRYHDECIVFSIAFSGNGNLPLYSLSLLLLMALGFILLSVRALRKAY